MINYRSQSLVKNLVFLKACLIQKSSYDCSLPTVPPCKVDDSAEEVLNGEAVRRISCSPYYYENVYVIWVLSILRKVESPKGWWQNSPHPLYQAREIPDSWRHNPY